MWVGSCPSPAPAPGAFAGTRGRSGREPSSLFRPLLLLTASGGTQSGFPASVLMLVAVGEADPGAWGASGAKPGAPWSAGQRLVQRLVCPAERTQLWAVRLRDGWLEMQFCML